MIIRVGDRVKVINPEFVERVGYPLSFSAAKEWVRANCSQDFMNLTAFGDKMLDEKPLKDILGFELQACDPWIGREGQRILSALAKLYQQHMGYGGRERSIYTVRRDEELGKTYAVTQRRTVKTGLYCPPHREIIHSYYGAEYEYYPGGLEDEKTHVLLCLGYHMQDWCEDFMFGLWIERCNVEKVGRSEEVIEP